MIISTREAFLGKKKLQDYTPQSKWIFMSEKVNGKYQWAPEFVEAFVNNGEDVDDPGGNRIYPSRSVFVKRYDDKTITAHLDKKPTLSPDEDKNSPGTIYHYNPDTNTVVWAYGGAVFNNVEAILSQIDSIYFEAGEVYEIQG